MSSRAAGWMAPPGPQSRPRPPVDFSKRKEIICELNQHEKGPIDRPELGQMTGRSRGPESPSHHTASPASSRRGDSSFYKQGKINWLRKKRGRQNPASEVAGWDMLHPACRRRFSISPGVLGAGGGVRLVYKSENTPRLGNPESEEPRMPNTTPRFLRWDDGSRRIGTTGEALAVTRRNSTRESICSQRPALGLQSLEGGLHGKSSVTCSKSRSEAPFPIAKTAFVSRDVET